MSLRIVSIFDGRAACHTLTDHKQNFLRESLAHLIVENSLTVLIHDSTNRSRQFFSDDLLQLCSYLRL
jgi:hypothetical protein